MTGYDGQEDEAKPWLVSRAGALLLALSLDHVIEVMRVPPVEPLAGAPAFVRGVGVVRGEPVPVIDAALLLSGREDRVERLVSLRVADRRFGLLVGSAITVRRFAPRALSDTPPLLGHVASQVVSAIGLLDQQFLFFLATALIVPETLLEGTATNGAVA